MVSALNYRLTRRRFDCRPFRFKVTTLGKLFTLLYLYHEASSRAYNFIPAKERRLSMAGKVTAGLAKSTGSRHPMCDCVHD